MVLQRGKNSFGSKYNQPLVKKCTYNSNNENENCVLSFPRSLYSSGYYYARVIAENGVTKDTDLIYYNY